MEKLTEMDCTLEGNKRAYKELIEAGMFDMKNFNGLYNESIDLTGGDFYYTVGNMINHFMSLHPKLKEAWSSMDADERWIFVEAFHYGIEGALPKVEGSI